jgi:predicted DNA-binding protein (MmcQ/YjbR family)
VTPAALKRYLAALPGATREIKWGVDQVYCIGGKMFAVLHEHKDGADCLSFKVDGHRLLELTDRKGVSPAPYLARAKWVQLKGLKNLPDAELTALLARAHEIIAAKLPKKVREALK